MFKKNLMKAKMVQLGVSTKQVAEIMGCSLGSFYRKMNGESEFTREEIYRFCKECGLSERELIYIFFGKDLRLSKEQQQYRSISG